MKKFNPLDTIVSPNVTEKATSLSEYNKIVFKVRNQATQKHIKKSIEKIFKVNVIKINTIKFVPNETFSFHFRCECNKGYKPHFRNEKRCVDEDECIVNNGGCDHMCTNIEVRI